MSKLHSLDRDKDLYEYKKNIMIVIDMSKSHSLLDLIISNDYPYVNLWLEKKEFVEIEDFIKENCFIINKYEKEDKWEYELEYEFLYKSKIVTLKHFKSYTSDCEKFLLRCEK